MPWHINDPGFAPDDRLEPWRDAVGALSENEEVIGYVVIEVESTKLFAGWRTFRPVFRSTEGLTSWTVIHSGPRAPVADVGYPTLSDLENGLSGYQPEHVRWLSGEERDAAWAEYQREWGDTGVGHA